ncbi:MAG: flagellar motor switch protein FliN [Chitinispirillaceae bacterium]|nr:flagellar motor switch protein FliN [Chitinispirillaceae bacterium]
MSEILSQDQIDQLLSAGGFESESTGTPGATGGMSEGDRYPSLEKNVELYCRHAGTVLSTVYSRTVKMECEACGKADGDTVKTVLGDGHLCLVLPFGAGLAGEMYFLVNKKDAAVMADLMMMGDGSAEYAPEHNDALTELSNQIMSSFALGLTTECGTPVSSSPSSVAPWTFANPPLPPEQLDMAIVKVSIEGKEAFSPVLLFPADLTAQLVEKNPATGAGVMPAGGSDGMDLDFGSNQGMTDQMQMGGMGESVFSPVQNKTIEMLLDIDLDVSIQLGQTTLSIKRILELAPGSIVELDRMAGEPVDLLVNNKPVAKGEVVVIDESFGIRILSLVSPEERIKSLR